MKRVSVVVVACAAFLIGCGLDEQTPGSAGRPDDAAIQADRQQDREIGLNLQRYMVRNCFPPGAKPVVPKKYRGRDFPPGYKSLLRGGIALCDSVVSITVNDSRVTLRSGLENDAEGREAGKAFCNLVRGSDVADFTPGHKLQDKEGETIRVCAGRTQP